jgi:hypothetical protein
MTKSARQKEPKTRNKATQTTPNASQQATRELQATEYKPASQVVKQRNQTNMLNTSDAPDGMTVKSRRKVGRPSKYKPIYCIQIIEFFNRPHTYESEVTHTNKKGESWTSYETKANPVPLMCDFAQYLGTTVETLWAWTKQHSEFLKASTHAQDLQLRHLATVTGLGLYNANWSVFMAKNISKWRDKKDIEHSGQVDSTLFINKMLDKSEDAIANKSRITNSLHSSN